MAQLPETQLFCLVCNSDIDFNACMNVFCDSLPQNGGSLIDFVLNVLKVSSSDLKSSYTCLRCYNLFGMLVQAQNTVANIQSEIVRIFQKSVVDNEVPKNKSPDHNFIVPEIVSNIFETEEGSKCIENSSATVINNPSEVNTKSLINITNQINNDAVISDNNVTTSGEQVESNVNFDESFNKADAQDNNLFFDENNENHVVYIKTCIEPEEATAVHSVSEQNLQSTNSLPKPSKYSQKPFVHPCSICDKKWRTTAELKSHMRSHSSSRPYICEICGRAYKHKVALEIHVGLHSGVSPFKCDHCDKCFTQKGALQRHLPMHTGEMPFHCEICGKRFKHHTSFNMHALSHTKQKSYKCHMCDTSLLSTSHLKRHMRKHTGEKPYSCDTCGRSFAERYNLLAHRKIHDSVLVPTAKEIAKSNYKCNQCEKGFSRKQEYQSHLKQHTKEQKTKDNCSRVEDPMKINVNGADLLETCVTEVWFDCQNMLKS